MTRSFVPNDMKAVLKIWLDASITAHNFIDKDFWNNKINDMRGLYLPNSETLVYEDVEKKKIIGFVSLVEDYLAAIFISPEEQGKGIGQHLMRYVKSQRKKIKLCVYEQNQHAVDFYKQQGFEIVGKQIEPETNAPELIMIFQQSNDI